MKLNPNHPNCKGLKYQYQDVLCCSPECYNISTNSLLPPLTYDFPIKFKQQNQSFVFIQKKIAFLHSERQFLTIVSEVAMTNGFHQIMVKFCNANHVKIGFTARNKIEDGKCFCDYDDGFGYYNIGQLRNGSSFHGKQYGKKVFQKSQKCDFQVLCILNKNMG